MQRRKIAVLRANGLGDFIFVLPALQAVRAAFPEAEIVFLGKHLHRELLAQRPSPLDRVEVVPPCPGVGEDPAYPVDEAGLEAFFSRMRAEKFDVALQLHGGGRYSNPFVLRLGAALTVGLQAADAVPLDISLPYRFYFSEILRYLEVVDKLGARTDKLSPQLTVIERDREAARQVIPALEAGNIAVIHPGATDIRRCWPAPCFAAAAEHLACSGLQVCISGSGPEEEAIARQIMQQVSNPAIINVCNRLSLNALVGLLDAARLMLSNDSGPLHLAEALQVPSVGIYLACNMINAMPMTMARSRPVIAWNTCCPLCGAGMAELEATAGHCAHQASFTTDVQVEDVISALQELQQSAPAGKPVQARPAAVR